MKCDKTYNIENKKTEPKIKGRGASRFISSSALIGWEEDDYNEVNKKLIDYGNKYKEIVNKRSGYPSARKDSRKISFVIDIIITLILFYQ